MNTNLGRTWVTFDYTHVLILSFYLILQFELKKDIDLFFFVIGNFRLVILIDPTQCLAEKPTEDQPGLTRKFSTYHNLG